MAHPTVPLERLSPTALRVRRLRGLIPVVAMTLTVVSVEASVRWGANVDLPWPPMVLPAVAIASIMALWWWWTHRTWAAWGWHLDGVALRVQHGVYWQVWQGVPRDRIQYVELTTDPLQRAFHLSTLLVRTAGVRTPAVIVADLDSDVAAALRAELSPETGPETSHETNSGAEHATTPDISPPVSPTLPAPPSDPTLR